MSDGKDDLVQIGLGKQLFVDDHVVSEQSGVKRELQSSRKENNGQPIRFWTVNSTGQRVPLKAWIYASPYYDDDRHVFRMWSRVYPDGTNMKLGYSESTNGIDFEFKSLLQGLHSLGDYNSVVYIDPHETDPAHRYKIGYDGATDGFPNGATLAHSADGITWVPYNQGHPVTGRAADFTNHVIWDEVAQTYRLFTRTDFGSAGGPGEIRGMRSMTNPAPKTAPTEWHTTSELLLDREGPDEHRRRQIYAMTDWIYCDVHFGLFAVYEWPSDFSEGRKTDHVKRHERDVMNYYLATSRDGDHWDWSWIYEGRPLIARGGDSAWDKDMILPANWIVNHDDRHWIYYGGANERHGVAEIAQPERDSAIGLASLPMDRFIGLHAADKPGVVTTKPFKLEGRNVQVNADCHAGKLAVEILDAEGKTISGFTAADAQAVEHRDELRATLRWRERSDCSEMFGRNIQLRFHLENATLFSFQVLDH
jgi:hypothetical protein